MYVASSFESTPVTELTVMAIDVSVSDDVPVSVSAAIGIGFASLRIDVMYPLIVSVTGAVMVTAACADGTLMRNERPMDQAIVAAIVVHTMARSTTWPIVPGTV